jgi:hypothetical protein
VSKSNAFETDFLKHVFQNAAIANVGDATGLRGSTAAGSLYAALHTADPGEAGDQTTSEAAYGSYARVAIPRDSSNWSVAAGQAQNINQIAWPVGTSGTVAQNITHWSIGVATSGASEILYSGAFTTALYSGNTIQPVVNANGLTITED